MSTMRAKDLGMKIVSDPAWKWQAGMLDGMGEWRLVAEVSPGDWFMVTYDEDAADIERCATIYCSPDWPDVRDPVTQLWMKDFSPVLVGEYLHAERETLRSDTDA